MQITQIPLLHTPATVRILHIYLQMLHTVGYAFNPAVQIRYLVMILFMLV